MKILDSRAECEPTLELELSLAKPIADWPGKSPVANGEIAHPAVYHFLDTAAVAEELIRPMHIDRGLGDALVLLVALHDLGKIGAPFRDMLLKGQPQARGVHWEVTEAYLHRFDSPILERRLGGCARQRHVLYAAAAGHHGRPPWQDKSRFQRMLDAASDEAVSDAELAVRSFLDLWPGSSLESLGSLDAAKKLSWRLAGLTTAADWIASNVDWFAPTAPGPTVEQYLATSRAAAKAAIVNAGLDSPPPRSGRLYDFALRPMQNACANAPLPEGPTLAILEDETGSGKTEAALILAHRMLCAGKGHGIYFALPTMATADAMFSRVAEIVLRMYERAPSLALAHGRAALSDRYRELKDARAHNPDEPGPDEWLADNRRRALLADVGVGTIDQALLAVVKAKHAPLRLFGLSSKILVVDEVHEMGDPYLGELLAKLLEVHAAQGGSAILLSATIPMGLRDKLVRAFESGAGRAGEAPQDPAYPALTISKDVPKAVKAASSARGPVLVKRIAEADAAYDSLTEAAAHGAACVWVRNAVDEAISAVEALRARCVPADLLHARFALVDRKRHEAAALQSFGKNRAPGPGRVLVATQIVESSLDLDFDVMISDLAPMAALIQRAGRLWRHMELRPAKSRPVEGPLLHVLAPDPEQTESDRWLQATLGGGAFVYPVALQWRTAKVLFTEGKIEAPHGLRALIEAAHSDTVPVPTALQTQEMKTYGQDGAARNLAWHNRIEWAEGYRRGARGDDDAEYPTRLGEPQRVLVLARRESGRLVPWSGGEWSVEACQMSEVQASARRLAACTLPDQAAPEIRAILMHLPKWISATRTICEVDHEGTIGEIHAYDSLAGLQLRRESR